MVKTSNLRASALTGFREHVENKAVNANTATEILIALLKRRQIHSSRQVSLAVALLLLKYISVSDNTQLADVERLISGVRKLGQRLLAAQPRELVIGNIVRRVLGVIRDEITEGDEPARLQTDTPERYTRSSDGTPPVIRSPGSGRSMTFGKDDYDDLSRKLYMPRNQRTLTRTTSTNLPTSASGLQHSMFSLLSLPILIDGSVSPSPKPVENRNLKSELISGIQEIIEELGQVDEQIAQHSELYIHPNEIVLTHGPSLTVQRFLLKAAVKRKFTVIVAESYPNDHIDTHNLLAPQSFESDKLAHDDPMSTADLKVALTDLGIEVILIPDSAVFALMSRINKVILGVHAVMANGSLVATAGAKTIAKSAKEHAVPVVVVTGVYKISPVYPFNEESLLEIGGGNQVASWKDGAMVEGVDVVNPTMDFVPEGLVDLYITNVGGHSPSYLYKLVEENYHVNDVEL